MNPTRIPRTLVVFVLAAGLAAFVVTWSGSLVVGVAAGLAVWLIAMLLAGLAARRGMLGDAHDPSRRRFLLGASLGGLAIVAGGASLGRALARLARPDAAAAQEAAAVRLGAEYMELVHRAYMPGRSAELQLVVAPFNSANYPPESRSLLPRDPRTSHAAPWMYLERIPLVVYGPGVVEPGDSQERVTLADLAPTTAGLIGFDAWPEDRAGRGLPGLRSTGTTPKVVVTFVIDGGGWNLLQRWPSEWPALRGVMRDGMNYRDAITGSFPAVTAAAHATIGTGTFPNQHGITGHNIRDGQDPRKAYGERGLARPSDIMVPTLADLWHDDTGAWVGEIGYQIWHLGMLGRGGADRSPADLPVGVYFDEDDEWGGGWVPHNPELYRMPLGAPGLESFEARVAADDSPVSDQDYAAWGNRYCCAPPIAGYQTDVLEAILDREPIGERATSLLYTTYKSPDYTGHVYGMSSEMTALMLRAVDDELARVVGLLEARFPGGYVLIVTADHGQCPLPDAAGGVRLDPIQLERVIEEEFGAGIADAVQNVYPSEVYLDVPGLRDAGATPDDVAAFLEGLTYRQNLGPYVPPDAVQGELLDRKEFAAVFASTWLDRLGDPAVYGATEYAGPDVDPGIPPASVLD